MARQRLAHRPALLQIWYAVEPPYLIVTVKGELDATTCGALSGCIDINGREVSTVLLDLGDLTFCDGDALRSLLAFRDRQLDVGRRFCAPRVHPRVRHVMEALGVADRFPP